MRTRPYVSKIINFLNISVADFAISFFRLREEGNKYRSFWQTLHTVWKEEGKAGIYR